MRAKEQRAAERQKRPIKVFMMDLWATVPYYTAYLSRALMAEGARVQIGSITYYLDRECFSSRGLKNDPGLLDAVGRFSLPKRLRQGLKLAEGAFNLAALSLRLAIRPPDIVHVQYLPMLRSPAPLDWWFVCLMQRRGVKIVLTVHDLLPHDTAERYRSVFAKLYPRMNALICHSDHVKSRLEHEFGIAEERISVIPHGPFFFDLQPDVAEAALLPALQAGQKIVLWQGIIFPYKGIDLLLDAWQTVEAEVSDATLVVMGTGAPRLLEEIRARVQERALRRVTLDFQFASTQKLVAMYRAADVVVYPYRAITTSGALATGMALGKAIVASDLPAFRELLEDGRDALLVSPGDRDQLATALISVLRDSELREQLAAAVRVRDFGARSWTAIAGETMRVYERLVSR
ncbi:MAG TPA: glycosyltransferase family 4 protein [Acidobacteriaceae bacterium]|jgi:glycosyltransferase involved in cell wall biosynthesis|nr:glycosyltransferase family 4 protein [Acidobacteriaceae bacterium]